MSITAKSFTAVGAGIIHYAEKGSRLDYSLSGTFSATLILERSKDNFATAETVLTKTAAASGQLEIDETAAYRWRCSAYTSGTAVTSIGDGESVKAETFLIPANRGKVGATAGWVVGATDNVSLATLPQSQTASTLVVPITGLSVGDKITGFHGVGQIESGGNTATLDIELRKGTSAAADVADSSVSSITQVSTAADLAVTKANASKAGLDEVVAADTNYYFLITGTTAASTDIALQSLGVTVLRK